MIDDDKTGIFHEIEMRIWMNEFDYRILALLKQRRERSENSNLNGDSNPDLCDAGAVLHQLNYQANWEQVVVWVDYNLVDMEIGDDITGFFYIIKI